LYRPKTGIGPKLADAELVTLAVMQALMGFTSEARWLRYARAHLCHLFPYLPQQPGYNKRLRGAAPLIRHCIRALAAATASWTDDVWIADSTRWSAAGPARPPNAPTWPDGPNTGTAPAIRDPGMIPLTVPEIKRLLAEALARPHPRGHATRWLARRRHHQARSRWFPQRTRLNRLYTLVS